MKRERLPAGPAGVIESGRRTLADSFKTLSTENLWFQKVKPAAYQNAITKISSKASKLSTLQTEDSSDVADQLFGLTTNVEAIQSLFTSIRADASAYAVKRLTSREKSLFQAADSSVMCSIVAFVVSGMLENNASVPAVPGVLSLAKAEDQTSLIGLRLVLEVPGATIGEAVMRAQMNLFYQFLEKVVKRVGLTDFIQVMSQVKPALKMTYTEVAALDEQVNPTEIMLKAGFPVKILIDISMLCVMSEVLAAQRDASGRLPLGITAPSSPFAMLSERISDRLKTYCSVHGGSHCNHAKAAWDRYMKHRTIEVTSISAESFKDLYQFFTLLVDVVNGDLEDVTQSAQMVFDVLSGAVDQEETILTQIGLVTSFTDTMHASGVQDATVHGLDGEQSSIRACDIARDLAPALTKAIQTIIAANGDFEQAVNEKLWLVEKTAEEPTFFTCSQVSADSEDESGIVGWIKVPFTFLSKLPLLPDEAAICAEVIRLIDQIGFYSGALRDIGKENIVVLKLWSEVWEKQQAPRCWKGRLPAGHGMIGFQNMVDRLLPLVDPENAIRKYVASIVGNPAAVSPLFVSTAEELEGVLPKSVQPMISSLKAYVEVKSVCTAVVGRRPVGPIRLTDALIMGHETQEPIKSLPEMKDKLEELSKEGAVMYAALSEKGPTRVAHQVLGTVRGLQL